MLGGHDRSEDDTAAEAAILVGCGEAGDLPADEGAPGFGEPGGASLRGEREPSVQLAAGPAFRARVRRAGAVGAGVPAGRDHSGWGAWINAGSCDHPMLDEPTIEITRPGGGHVAIRGSFDPEAVSRLIKVIWWDGQGACLFSKRLERGRFVSYGLCQLLSARLFRPPPAKGVAEKNTHGPQG